MKTSLCILLSFLILSHLQGVIKGDSTKVFNTSPGEQIPVKLTLGNDEEEPSRITLRVCDYSYNAKGETYFDEPNNRERSNASWIELHTDQVVIPPHENRDLFYKINVPNDKNLKGSYWSLILIEPDKISQLDTQTKESIQIQVKIRYAYLIVTNIGKGTGNLEMMNTQVSDDKQLQLDVANTGTLFLTPKALLHLYNAQGQLVTTRETPPQKLLPQTSVRYSFAMTDLPKGKYSGLLLLESGEESLFGERIEISL